MGEMKKLREVCSRITDGSHYSPPASDTGYPMLSVKDMGAYDFIFDNCKLISKNEYDAMVRNGCVPKVNDVVIAKDGSYLKEVFVITEDREIAILSSIGILRPDTKQIDPYYLKYYLSSDQIKYEVGRKYVTGSALPRIILDNFGEIEIPIIPVDEQKQIVTILRNIDSKISNNNAICSDLESMAKLLYDYWFVQFDFPDENGKPYKSSGGKMVWNEELKREIPEGWVVKTILDLGVYVSDFTANGSFAGLAENVKYNEGERYAILVRSVDFSNAFEPSKYVWINQHGYEYLKSCHLKGGEIIIINVGAVGDTYRVPYLRQKMALGPNGLVIKAKHYDNYIYSFLKSSYGYSVINSMASGSVQRKFNKTDFRNMTICVPPEIILAKFNESYKPIYDAMNNLWLESRQLASLRDFLLPMLMNGQVKIGKGNE